MRVCTVGMAAALPGVHVGPSWAGGQRACSAVSSGKPAGEVKPTRRRCRRRRRVMLASARAAPSSRLVWPTSSSQTCVPERLTALPQHLGPAFQLPVSGAAHGLTRSSSQSHSAWPLPWRLSYSNGSALSGSAGPVCAWWLYVAE